MKTILVLIFCLTLTIFGNGAFGETNTPSGQWAVTLNVVDEKGNAVEGADAWVAYYLQPRPDDPNNSAWDKVEGQTDANGIFTASHDDTHSISLGFHVRKEGYYPTDVIHEFDKFGDSDSNKRNPRETLILKRIENPIPMYAKRIIGMPSVLNQPLGYDLTKGDWIAPYGKGTNADIFFTGQKIDKDTEFVVTFPHSDDGIQEFRVAHKLTEGSALRSAYEAPNNGYEPQLVRTSHDYDENRCYFFRVRTESSAGALYGKIYGDPMSFCYYLNPEPNSRNIEFDPKKNLVKNFRLVAERVNAP